MGGVFSWTGLWLGLAIVAGAFVSVQVGINALLARHLGGPLQATLASFLVGTAALAAASVVRRAPWPPLDRLGHVPMMAWTGGLLGAFYVGATIVLSARLGAATLFAFVVGAQMVTAVVLDHFGAVGFAVHPVTFLRLAGVVLIVAGVVLIRAF